jgi:hypothetical protein
MSNDNLPAIQNWSPQFTGKVTFDYDDVTYTVENGKIYNDLHEVAVVYSPGYGGGWTAYNKDIDPTDARVAVLTLTGAAATLKFMRYGEEADISFKARKVFQYDSSHGDDLAIHWLPAGTLYKIEEYDGYESVVTNTDIDWRIS